MSRFFARADSDSDTSSSDEELYGSDASSEEQSSSEEEEESDEEADESGEESEEEGAGKGKSSFRNKFLKGAAGGDSSESESESEDEKRVLKSAKDKLIDEIDASIKSIENGKKINDWVAISGEFDKLNKLVERAVKQYQTTPKQYVKSLVELDDFAQEASKNEKQAKKKMNASNSRALNTIKQRIKKTSRDYESQIAQYNENPDSFGNEEESEDEAELAPKPKSKKDIVITTVPSADDNDGFATVGKAGKVLQFAPETLFKTLMTIVESRGKKNTDRAAQITTLEELLKVAKTPYQKISVLLMLIPIRFDLTSSGSVMPTAHWKSAQADISVLFQVLEEHSKEIRVIESAPEPEDLETGPQPGPDGVKEIPGSVSSLIERLDDELTRALQQIDPHTIEYVDRLGDENELYILMLRAQCYLEANLKGTSPSSSESLSRLIVRRLDHLYYKPTSVIIATEQRAWSTLTSGHSSHLTPRIASTVDVDDKQYPIDLINALCAVLYQQANTVFRTKAMLSHVYHYALNDYYFKARDMFLMSHLQSSIHTADPTVQVLFNRALVQVGLCAFRIGLISESQQSLQEICSSSRLKELLGQGVTKYNTAPTTPDRQRLLPFHMHINLELLECVYLTASLLIEIPYMASLGGSVEGKKKIVSKPFRRLLDYHERQVFTGPPETTRDHIMQAAKALLNGDWTNSRDLLLSIKIWSLMANPEKIKEMLTQKVQEEGLRTYLFNYGPCYQSVAVETLAKLFDLSPRKVSGVVSKLIATEEIAAALDQKTNSVVFRQGIELSRLQALALALSEKAAQLAERNERLAAGGHQLDAQNITTKTSERGGSQTTSNVGGQRTNRPPGGGRQPQQPRPVRV
jgi:translation initiation factor 3 subunit C